MAPNTKPYSTISVDCDDDEIPTGNNHYSDNPNGEEDDNGIAVQTLELQDHMHECEVQTSKGRSWSRCRALVAVTGVVALMVVGGREAYLRNEQSPSRGGAIDEPVKGVRGGDVDLPYAEELFEGANDESGDFNERPPDIEEEYESEVPEEEFDIDEPEEVYEHPEEPEEEYENNEVEEEEEQGEEFEPEAENEIEEPEEENEIQEPEENEKEVEEEELPDYFVPLTPAEREELKDRLRATVSLTKSSLEAYGMDPNNTENFSPQRTPVLDPESPKQFMHMHHMKTGGTSMDSLIRCALNRQKTLNDGNAINYRSMSECGSGVRMCMENLAKELDASVVENVFYRNDEDGKPIDDAGFDPAEESHDDLNVCNTADANVMSYCASLHAVRTFGWKDVDKITVIRNPIDRAWSMYKYSLTGCYSCQPMSDVLEKVANGTFTSHRQRKDGDGDGDNVNFVYSPNDSCATQMIGHQATNLLSSIDLYNIANDVRFPREKEIAEEAVRNLRNDFTWIGLTDRIQESADAFRVVFPFLAENLSESALRMKGEIGARGIELPENAFVLPQEYVDTNGCPMPHANAGRDPTCGTTKMDDYTISLIQKLSNRDVAVYKAAVERFELQMEVLEEFKGQF